MPLLAVPTVGKSAPLLWFCIRPGYRERHTTFFIRPFAEAGWRVQHQIMDLDKPMFGLPERAAKSGMPDAVVQWEEHAVARATQSWRDFIAWCYDREVVPLMIDFGYFGHYQHFVLDCYERDGHSSIHAEWDKISDEPIDWQAEPFDIRDYRRRVLRGYAEARDKPSLIEGDYVAFWLQQYSTLSRLQPRNHNNAIVAKVAQECRKRGLRLAVKTAPSTNDKDALREWPDDVQVFRHEKVGRDTNQRLAVHAKYCLVVSSSITNEFLLCGLPVVALGRSWYMGHDVFFEPDAWEDLPARAPAINQKARNKYARWWLSRQFMSERAAPHLNRIVECSKRAMDMGSGTTITCVYAPDKNTEQVAAASLKCTRAALPKWKRVIAIDAASPALTLLAMGAKATVLADGEGEPPRMGRLLAAAVGQATGEFVFTIEHDVLLDADQAKRAVEVIRGLPNRVASLYLQSTDAQGTPNYPWRNDWPNAVPWRGEHFRQPQWPTLNCTLWRTHALRQVDWRRVPALEFVDGAIGNQLSGLGYVHLMTDLASAIHLPHTGRGSLRGRARTLAIGCERNIWGRRGIRFGWNGEANLDVAGTVCGALPFDADSFREIYVCDGLRGLNPDQQEIFIGEARRVLRRGGRLDISGPGCGTGGADLFREGFRVERKTANRVIAWNEK